jgi:putative transcriptional regulator
MCKAKFTFKLKEGNMSVHYSMQEIIINQVSIYRAETGITQEDLACNVGVSRQTIIALEKGNYTPSILLALKIAKFFKVSVEKIFTLSYEK